MKRVLNLVEEHLRPELDKVNEKMTKEEQPKRKMYFEEGVNHEFLVLKDPQNKKKEGFVFYLDGMLEERYPFNRYYLIKKERGNRVVNGLWIEYWYRVYPIGHLANLKRELENLGYEQQIRFLVREVVQYRGNSEFREELYDVIQKGFMEQITVSMNMSTKEVDIREWREKGNHDIIDEIVDEIVTCRHSVIGECYKSRMVEVERRVKKYDEGTYNLRGYQTFEEIMGVKTKRTLNEKIEKPPKTPCRSTEERSSPKRVPIKKENDSSDYAEEATEMGHETHDSDYE